MQANTHDSSHFPAGKKRLRAWDDPTEDGPSIDTTIPTTKRRNTVTHGGDEEWAGTPQQKNYHDKATGALLMDALSDRIPGAEPPKRNNDKHNAATTQARDPTVDDIQDLLLAPLLET
eukprot:CAMPEP_0201227246 /NCGR_PEP_ID=MMETSP0851-20130426/195030_1 /ASSEMBLY_ACC=CAM_ASM_000631 /TAXON_ID=183588 /ORGANISM="Pseudo-nitzschia fraudulenta, Strain WWA7" /LENGTH=117 /DNA_ID=CAMNT_0047517033 /DNA_START=579 /DNA_END=929 /DNA_ORIENTATION=-